ncbi:MAG: phage major capsid protein [Collimonas pratensis]
MPHKIKEQRAQVVAEMRQMVEAAQTEKRSLSGDEAAKFDLLKTKITELEAQESRAVFLAEAERRQHGHVVDRQTVALESRINLLDAIRSQMNGGQVNGALAEFQQEATRSNGRAPEGLYVPMSAFEKRDAQTTTTAAGIVHADFRADQFIGPLRNSLMMRSLGARVLSGLRGDLTIPKYKSGMSAGWVGENEALTESGMSFEDIGMKPRHVGALTEMSRQLIQQSDPSVEQLVRDDLSFVMAEALDRAMLTGDGVKEPLGLLNRKGLQTGSLADPTWTAVLALLQKIEDANVTANSWLTSSTVATKLRGTLKSASAGAAYLAESGRMADLPLNVTKQVPLKAGKGQIILGDFSQILLGLWGEVDLLVNPYAETAYKRGGVMVRTMMTADVNVRHEEAFVVASDVA